MSYIDIDLKDKEHQRAVINFEMSGHPRAYLGGSDAGDYDIDIEYREMLAEKLDLDFEATCGDPNGSTHKVISADPKKYKLYLEFYADKERDDFAVEVEGQLKYNTEKGWAVFFSNDETIRRTDPVSLGQ